MTRWQQYDWDLMVRRRAPVPLVAAALLLALWLATAESGSITGAKCQADRDDLMAAIAAARQQTIDDINAQLAATDDAPRIESLTALHEQAWDDEESQRSQAQHIFNDCMAATRRPG